MTQDAEIQEASPSHPVWRIATVVVSAVSLAWVLWLLASVWPDLARHRHEIAVLPLMAGFFFSVLGSCVACAVFVTLAPIFRITGFSARELAHFYFTGQLLKHLPGRIWGIGYQWAANPVLGSFHGWVLANLAHLLIATYFALWTAAVVLAFVHEAWWGLSVFACGIGFYAAGWGIVRLAINHPWPAWMPQRLGRFRERIGESLLGVSIAVQVRIFFLFLASSLCCYLSWYLYGAAYPVLGGNDAVQLCAYYMLAWLLGYLSLLTPSGLGVRELAFAWMARDFPGDSVAYLAVIGRASLLVVDLLLGVMFVPFAPRKR